MMKKPENSILTVAFLNIRGQSGLTVVKQLQIEAFAKVNNCDIVNLQEAHIEEDSFSTCDFICSSYNSIDNNSITKYGTACLVKSELCAENIRVDSQGRVIVFDIGQITLANMYLHSGTDSKSRTARENYSCEIIPALLNNCKAAGVAGGDLNCIIDKKDATHHPEAKFSKGFQRLVKLKEWEDSFRTLHPNQVAFSRHYENTRASGATRIDRSYHYGGLKVLEAKYLPLAFSDHFGYVVKYELPELLSRAFCPKSRHNFRLKAEVIKDSLFQERLKDSMVSWKCLRGFGLDTMIWWEKVVKPGIKKLGLQRCKELGKEKREYLNLLLLRQCYHTNKVQKGESNHLAELKTVHLLIEQWYSKESEKVQHQARVNEFQCNEKTTVYHHELHKRSIKKTSILKLETEQGLLEGHTACADYLESSVEKLLLHPAVLNHDAQQVLLEEVVPVFTAEDNKMILKVPTSKDVWETVCNSNLNAAPGSDGLPSLLYKECWSVLGEPLTEVMLSIHKGAQLSSSQRTSLMVFGSKPKKPNSKKPSDKRKISLLNADFKVGTGLEAKWMKKVATHTLSHLQLVAGSNRRIHHGINLARNAIYSAGKNGRNGCGILDTDLIAAFDYMCLEWAFMVLEKKGLDRRVINRLENLYMENISVIVVNNIPGKAVKNIRMSLRQGDLPSMHLFSFGIDPVLTYLEKRLQGILISSVPLHGPVLLGAPSLGHLEERYKVIGYADDIKPAITTMHEFSLVDKAMNLFEESSGCKLHRDPSTQKCKFLPLGRWRGTLQQNDIPCPYMSLSDHLDMLGVELRATWTQTRKANCDILQDKVDKTVRQWKSGKFMPLTMRAWSMNSYCLPKIWFRSHCVDLRQLDISKIHSHVKSWMYGDQFLKPEERVLFRPPSHGGLGVHHAKLKAQASLTRSFLETACHPHFIHSLYHSSLFRFHVLEDTSIPDPGFPPFYPQGFFAKIREVHIETPLNVATMTQKQWYTLLLEDCCTMEHREGETTMQFIRTKTELASPETDWENSWRLARLHGLGPEHTSFLFKLLHKILPTQ